ncbi:MATE family efflux transporter [Anaerotalea alkaliphila]|uniref:MATE family efflux transporter n=1 Tax=Anaerotalea alkaliphila TaxID=2662126 RepID=A0A7X5KNA5_9FIRM|nr:MATE family efflux transporter [Anaerotalea alkaliphila]NDL67578.1 MATE family efflux transporter [Anaerotalea alkaliphila]
MENKGFYRKLLAIAMPVAFQNLITSFVNTIDVFMISSLGSESISGVGIANRVFFLLHLFLFGTASGSAILTAQFWGAGDVKSIRKALGISLTLGMGGAALFTLGAVAFPEFILGLFTREAGVVAEGAGYLRIVGVSYGFTAVAFAYMFVLRSTGVVKLPVVVTVIAVVLNTFFNYVLIFGHFGAPRLGVQGAAYATVAARAFECLLLLHLSYRFAFPTAGKIRELFSYSMEFFLKYVKIVLPVVANELAWALGVTMYAVVFGRMGKEVMASMTITQTVEQFAFVLAFGVANASGVILGNSLGADRKDEAMAYAKRFLKIGASIGLGMGAFMYLAAPWVTGIFRIEPLVATYVLGTLRVFSLFMFFKVMNLVAIVGILRSGGDTAYTMLLDVLGVWVVAVPLAFFSGLVLGLDIRVVYALIMVEEVLKVGFAIHRTVSGKWLKNLASDPVHAQV